VGADRVNVRSRKMRISRHILWTVAFIFLGCSRSSPVAGVIPLSFYIVSDVAIPGGRYIDSPDFPKLGYIASTPDMVLERLEAVTFETPKFFTPPRPIVNMVMRKESLEPFASLTDRAQGKRILLMIGDLPLTAPLVKERISTSGMYIDGGKGTSLKKIADELKKLVR
jgi:hypothetical protein